MSGPFLMASFEVVYPALKIYIFLRSEMLIN